MKTITEQEIKNFLTYKGIMEERAINIAKRIFQLNPKECFLSTIVKIEFDDTSVCITTSGYARGYYEESIGFPLSYMWDENWEEKYQMFLQEEKDKKQIQLSTEAKNKEASDLKKLAELKAKYPNA